MSLIPVQSRLVATQTLAPYVSAH